MVHTCLDRREFRPAIVCENCELHLDGNTHASMSVAELQRLRGKEARETWAPSNVEATRQVPSKVSLEEFERKRKRERKIAMSQYEARREGARRTGDEKRNTEIVREGRESKKKKRDVDTVQESQEVKEKRLVGRPKVVKKVRFELD